MAEEIGMIFKEGNLFQELVEGSMVGMYLNDGERFIYVNQAFAQLFGYTREEMVGGLGPIDVVAPSFRHIVSRSLTKRLRGKVYEDRFVVELLRKDGSTFWGEVFGKGIALDGKRLIMGSVVDISDQKRAEDELRESRNTFERVINTISDLVVLLDRDLRIKLANPAVFKAIKQPPKGFQGRYCYEIFQRRDSVCPQCPALEAMETGKMVRRMRYNPDGTVLDRRVYPIFNDRGEVEELLIVASDVTEKYQAEEALKRSEALYRSLMDDVIDKSNVGVFILDADFNVVWVNKAMERFFGFKREEVIGKSKRELIKNHIKNIVDEGEGFEARVLATYDNNTYIENFVCHVLPGDGREERWLEHWSQPIESGPFAGGRIEHYHDITPLRTAEEKLRENEEFLRSLLTSIEDGISVLDRDLNIVYANPNVEEWHRDEMPLVGKKCYRAYQKRETPCEDCPSLRCLESGKMEVVKKTVVDCEGERRWIELHAYPFRDSQGKVKGVVEFVKDFTEQKRLEEQLHLSQRLEAVGRLAGGIAHDFNNVLMVILGSCELLQEELLSGTVDKASAEERVGLIRKAAEKAAELTRQLLVFSKKQVMEAKVVDLNEGIAEIKRMLERVIGEDIELEVKLANQPCRVKVDPAHMDQVIMNLVMNAREAMPQGGTLSISTDLREIRDPSAAAQVGLEPGSYVVLSVRDTGVGMDEETKKRIFEPFFTTKDKGTGLGLATVYGVVSQLNGTIHCHSEPNKGTLFEVYLPEAEEPSEYGSAEAHEQVKDHPETKGILVVEDEEAVRMLTVTLLKKVGYRVFEASNGEEALKILEKHNHQIDLVLTDVVMPRMGGKELVQKISEKYPNLKVIFMSGYPSDTPGSEASEIEEKNTIYKPFSKDKLFAKIREALRDS